MKKRVSPLVVALPAFVLFAVFKLWPFILSIIISFQEYKSGILGSMFVGTENYKTVLMNHSFGELITNSFLLTLYPAVLTAMVAFLISSLISSTPKQWLKYILLCVVSISAVLPSIVVVRVFMPYTRTETESFPLIYTIAETLRYMILPIAYGVLTADHHQEHRTKYLLKISVAYVLFRFAFMFTADVEMPILLWSHSGRMFSGTLSLHSYRKGVYDHSTFVSFFAALDVMRTIVQMLVNIPLFFGLKKLLFSESDHYIGNHELSSISVKVLIVTGIVSLVALWLYGGFGVALGAFVFICMSFLLAYPLTMKSKFYPVLLFLLITLNCTTAEHIFHEAIGITGTQLQAALILGVSAFGALIIFLLMFAKRGGIKTLRTVIPVIIITLVMSFNFAFERSPDNYHKFKNYFDPIEIEVAKPVIYLYPNEKTDISVSLEFDGQLTFTYPEYDNGWEVTAYPDGTIIDGDGNEYSYLFWEGTSDVQFDLSKGFVVSGNETVNFLREKLSYMGLTPKEYNDFIVYWAPLLQENEYNLISFQGAAYEKAAELFIAPQPDSILRVFMTAKPLSKPIEVEEQVLKPFERNGFTVVEWGGSIVH